MVIIDRIMKKKLVQLRNQSMSGGEPSKVYIGYRERNELYNMVDIYSHIDLKEERHKVCGLEIYEVNEDSHLEVF